MPSFFIDRPIFAWVVALFICLIGAISIPFLRAPSIRSSRRHHRDRHLLSRRVAGEPLQQRHPANRGGTHGANGILSFESTSDSLGRWKSPRSSSPAPMSRWRRWTCRTHQAHRVAAAARGAATGILIEEASSAVLQIITLSSTDGRGMRSRSATFMVRNVLGEIRRIPASAAPRCIPPNSRCGSGSIRTSWSASTSLPTTSPARSTPERAGGVRQRRRPAQQQGSESLGAGAGEGPARFAGRVRGIVLRANPDGSTVRLRDVARIEIGGMGYQFTTRLNGKRPPASRCCWPRRQRVATASAVEAKMKELSKFFPANIKYEIPYNITPVVKASIEKVLHTLVEAVCWCFS